MARATVHCRWENPAWLTYAASGNIAVCLNTDAGLLFIAMKSKTFDG